jgi:hypothetical protein
MFEYITWVLRSMLWFTASTMLGLSMIVLPLWAIYSLPVLLG